ncbi:MAG: hypothetical protein IPP54_08315 [Anaerolineales bacterium]|nr:hypothetical protein [Anaerolineales bacterium]
MVHDAVVTSVSFSPDGKYVVSGSYDATIRVWAWRSEDLIANACRNLPRNLTREEWAKYIGDFCRIRRSVPICRLSSDCQFLPAGI